MLAGAEDDVQAFLAELNLPEGVRVTGPVPLDEDFFAHQHSAPAGVEGGGEGDISEPSPSGAEDAVPGDWRAILFFTYAQAPQVTHELRSRACGTLGTQACRSGSGAVRWVGCGVTSKFYPR